MTQPTLEDVRREVANYLADKWQASVAVVAIEQIFGGASRETYLLQLDVDGASRGVVLRRDPPSSLIDTERALEYGAYAAIYPTSIPVPEPFFLENDESILGAAFSIMGEVANAISDVAGLSAAGRQRIGAQKWRLLGNLAAMDPIQLGFDDFCRVPELERCAAEQLSYWRSVIEIDEIHPQPVAAAALRWLERNLPAPAQKLAVVHGDYRSGNFLYEPEGDITAVLDWEMCHLGDPMEDLAWSLDPLWCWGNPELAGNLLPYDQAIAIWEQASGLILNRQDFYWWRVFAAVKGLAIWISSSEDFHSGSGKQSILAYAGWAMTDRQNRILLDYLSPLSARQFGGPRL
ncbi:MAG: aminoglycoside phosphotransferase (APT) family kinase protein [Candidatus Azotimanducaceae bacterium]|jgi:aminoglycoside phosphotransferase (APT) family kinase protein